MTKMRLVVELDYDEKVWGEADDDEWVWFLKDEELLLYANDAGDTVGALKVLQVTVL